MCHPLLQTNNEEQDESEIHTLSSDLYLNLFMSLILVLAVRFVMDLPSPPKDNESNTQQPFVIRVNADGSIMMNDTRLNQAADLKPILKKVNLEKHAVIQLDVQKTVTTLQLARLQTVIADSIDVKKAHLQMQVIN